MQVPQCHLEHTYIGAGCSNQMQLAHGHHLNADFAIVQPAFGVLCFVLFVICNCLCFICYVLVYVSFVTCLTLSAVTC